MAPTTRPGPDAARPHRAHRSIVALPVTLLIVGLLIALLPFTSAQAGVLDELWSVSSKQGPGRQAQRNPGAARANQKRIAREARKERRALRKLSERKLTRKAKQGERAAQIMLATRFSQEARIMSLTIGAANAAISDSVAWYALAAKRGFPGAAPVDGILPAFPIRARRSPQA